jgi:hypothetical protein
MKTGFTEKEARDLIGQSFETRAPFFGIPLRTRGEVIEVLDSGDHWNVIIKWRMAGPPTSRWFNKEEVQLYMTRVPLPAA